MWPGWVALLAGAALARGGRTEGPEGAPVRPNIILVLVDDVGWADFNYNTEGGSPIPTPNIDRLAGQGIKLSQHYVHPTCTPSRAALMTGRYSANTGLPFAMYPGSVAGLPPDMATLPGLIREAGYSAHMVGKWHLGHSQPRQGPLGRGFQSHTGSHMWDIESYSKLLWGKPWQPAMGADWVTAHENGSVVHRAEPRHATTAITEAALAVMRESAQEDAPLLLYVAYTAAHSPLQPEPEWEAQCTHIPHLWRRQYCGMVVGLDLAIGRLVEEALARLGPDTVLLLSSDNGGSVWFGGLNAPLRSGKHTSFEGGVRVPAFALDLSAGRHLGPGGRTYTHMAHISDWLPTALELAGGTHLLEELGLDGVSLVQGLREGSQVRTSVLLDLYTEADSHDGKALAAYRKGDYKVIRGSYKDPHWYSEPTEDRVATSDPGRLARLLEHLARLLDWTLGEGPCDSIRMLFFNIWLFNHYTRSRGEGEETLLFDVVSDPEERRNLAPALPGVAAQLLQEVDAIVKGRPRTPRYWMVSHNWTDGFVPGDCSGQDVLPARYCRFTGPWLPDSADLADEAALGLVDVAAEATREMLGQLLALLGGLGLGGLLLGRWVRG